MKMLGTDLCTDCREAKETLDQKGIAYEYTDFTESIEVLKEFLRFRDSHKEFGPAKEEGNIGIPCFVFEDGSMTFDLEEAVRKSKQA